MKCEMKKTKKKMKYKNFSDLMVNKGKKLILPQTFLNLFLSFKNKIIQKIISLYKWRSFIKVRKKEELRQRIFSFGDCLWISLKVLLKIQQQERKKKVSRTKKVFSRKTQEIAGAKKE